MGFFSQNFRAVAVCVFLIHLSLPVCAQTSFYDADIPLRSVVAIGYSYGDNQYTSGMGVYVGDSQVYTATHVLGNLKSPDTPIDVLVIDHFLRPVRRTTARVEKFNPNSDAAMLQLSDAAGLLTLPACENQSPIGNALVFVRFQGSKDSPISAWDPESRQLWKADLTGEQFLRGALERGYSGGPALDQAGKCFLGIVSRVDTDVVISGGITPTQTIRSRTKLVPINAFTSKMQEIK